MDTTFKLKSEWKVSITSNNIQPTVVDWSENVILDSGLDYWLDNFGVLQLPFSETEPMAFTHIALGDDNTPAVITDTALLNETYRSAITTTYSYDMNVDDPTAPYIILGAEIPSGTGTLSIKELGICNSSDYFFNRLVITEVVKMPLDVVIIQCKITLTRLTELYNRSQQLFMNPFYGALTHSCRSYTCIFDETLAYLLGCNSTTFDMVGTLELGSNTTRPTKSDGGVLTEMLSIDDFPYVVERGTLHSMRIRFGIPPIPLHLSDHSTDIITEIAITGWPVQFRTTFEWLFGATSYIRGLGHDLPDPAYDEVYAPMFGYRLEFAR